MIVLGRRKKRDFQDGVVVNLHEEIFVVPSIKFQQIELDHRRILTGRQGKCSFCGDAATAGAKRSEELTGVGFGAGGVVGPTGRPGFKILVRYQRSISIGADATDKFVVPAAAVNLVVSCNLQMNVVDESSPSARDPRTG